MFALITLKSALAYAGAKVRFVFATLPTCETYLEAKMWILLKHWEKAEKAPFSLLLVNVSNLETWLGGELKSFSENVWNFQFSGWCEFSPWCETACRQLSASHHCSRGSLWTNFDDDDGEEIDANLIPVLMIKTRTHVWDVDGWYASSYDNCSIALFSRSKSISRSDCQGPPYYIIPVLLPASSALLLWWSIFTECIQSSWQRYQIKWKAAWIALAAMSGRHWKGIRCAARVPRWGRGQSRELEETCWWWWWRSSTWWWWWW